jgi:hypothetical protein
MRTILFAAVLAFSVVAAADTIDYAAAGSIKNGTVSIVGSIANGQTWSVTEELMQMDDETTHVITRGNLGKVDITTGTLMACSVGFSTSRIRAEARLLIARSLPEPLRKMAAVHSSTHRW